MARTLALGALGALCLALAGCDGALLTAPAKINAAFPGAPMRAGVLPQLESEYQTRLKQRGELCAATVAIGRFATLATLRAMPALAACMQAQDQAVQDFLGLRMVGIRLAQAPLRPLLPLGSVAQVRASGKDLAAAAVAARAGVAIAQDRDGAVISFALPGGEKIASLPALTTATTLLQLSPNGRVTVTATSGSIDAGTLFVDNETGEVLWRTRARLMFVAWLPEVAGALANDKGQLALLDFERGRISAHPAAFSAPLQAIALGGKRILVGGGANATMLEHVRRGDGIAGSAVTSFPFTFGYGVFHVPLVMQAGRTLVFSKPNGELHAVDLETGKERSWPTADFLSSRIAKLSETTLLVDAFQAELPQALPMVFDIEAGTLAPVAPAQQVQGMLTALDGRPGFMRRSGPRLWLADQVDAGPALPLDAAASAYRVANQAKIDRLNPR